MRRYKARVVRAVTDSLERTRPGRTKLADARRELSQREYHERTGDHARAERKRERASRRLQLERKRVPAQVRAELARTYGQRP